VIPIFIGRERELASLKEFYEKDGKVLTLVFPYIATKTLDKQIAEYIQENLRQQFINKHLSGKKAYGYAIDSLGKIYFSKKFVLFDE